MDYQLITTHAQLVDACKTIGQAEYCAIDTEFIRQKTYYPQLALIQVATEQILICIDPLAVDDCAPFAQLLQKTDLLKVFHSSSQDLEILLLRFGAVPAPVFDTQLAAAIIGYKHQISYADLVFKITGVQLEKKHTLADWTRRPLSKNELDYAMDDVRYLLTVYRQIKQTLEVRNRAHWLASDFAAMSLPSTYALDLPNLWKRVKGAQNLKGVQQQIVHQLCLWREGLAQEKNSPRRWILADEQILAIAQQRPTNLTALRAIDGIPEVIISRYGQTFLDIVTDTGSAGSHAYPQGASERLTVEQRLLGNGLMGLCQEIAQKNEIATAAFATRKDIDRFICHRESSRLSQGWRFELAGEQLQQYLQKQLGVEAKA